MSNQKSFAGLIQAFAVFYIIAWSVSPPLGIDLAFRLLALGLAAVWAFIALMRRIQFENIHIWALVFILIIVYVTYIRYNSFSNLIKQINWYMFFVEFVIFSYYCKKDCWDELSFVLPLIFILLIYFNYQTVIVLIEDPTIARLIVRADESIYGYMRQGVGGYAMVYVQVLMFPAALYWILKAYRKSKIRFIIGAVWLVSYGFLIAKASFSIALFSTFASLFVLFLYKGRSVVGVVVITLILFLGTMAAIMYIAPLREWLLQTFDGTAVAKKINDLVNPSETGEDSIQVRINQYLGSLSALLQYPIIGSLWRQSKAGTHSHILDTFAMYGWWGGYMNIRVLFSAPRYYKEKYKSGKIISVANAEFVVMIFISLLDTLPFEMMCPFFLLVPLLMQDIIKWTEKENS